MQKIAKILVATDFSEKADSAILRAMDIAKKNQATLTLINIAKKDSADKWIGKLLPVAKKIIISPKEYATQMVNKKIKKYAKKSIKMNGVVLTGHPAEKILQYAKKQKIDLIVMGARGEYSIHDWFVGTTTEAVVKNTKIPTLIVKNIPRKPYQSVLVPIDFSSPSQMALQFACNHMSHAKLEVLHVADHEYEEFLKNESIDKEKLKSIRKTIIHALKEKTDQFINENRSEKISYKVKIGYPSLEITKEAGKRHVDLIVMGTSGHSKQHYVLLGRVATMVLYEANADILLIPPIR